MAAAAPFTGTAAAITEDEFFQPDLIKLVASENIYEEENPGGAPPWEISDDGRPYLKHVKGFSKDWRHLRVLADFMQVGTTPLRWQEFTNEPGRVGKWSGEKDENNRENRASRTNVTRLDYSYVEGTHPAREDYKDSASLRKALEEQNQDQLPRIRKFRLFIVEDLSRDVIELLGAHYDVEPTFFRDQIFDYAWYNTRDRWMDPPRLNIVAKRQRWLQIRFATTRYFENAEMWKEGKEQVEAFNVFRRPENDLNNSGVWDHKEAIVGLSRTRAAFWMGSEESHPEGAVGILLVDPTIKAGFPLWRGYRNWEETPSIRDLAGGMPAAGPSRKSFFEDLIYWLQKPEVFGSGHTTSASGNIHVPIQALLYLICGEWLTIAEYIQTRLCQVEWEVSFPEHFLDPGVRIDRSLNKLHIWRRLVPLYHTMLTETLERVFKFPCHGNSITSSWIGLGNLGNANPHAGAPSGTPQCFCPLHNPAPSQQGPINALRDDFLRLRASMEEFQQRIDRLTAVVTSSITIDDSHRGLKDTTNVTRLTWLATCFIPFSLTATIFTMPAHLDIGHIVGWYILMALVLVGLIIAVAFYLTGTTFRNHFRSRKQKQKMS